MSDLPFLKNNTRSLNQINRDNGEHFINLTSGITHYQYKKHDSGNSPIIIMLHGSIGPLNVWDATYKYL